MAEWTIRSRSSRYAAIQGISSFSRLELDLRQQKVMATRDGGHQIVWVKSASVGSRTLDLNWWLRQQHGVYAHTIWVLCCLFFLDLLVAGSISQQKRLRR